MTIQDFDEQEKVCLDSLHTARPEEYGEDYHEHLLRQYELYANSINIVSDLKHKVNSYFLGIHTILITAVGISVTKDFILYPNTWHIVIPIIGIFLSIVWWYTSRSYKEINRVKFKILHCIEERLPLAPFWIEYRIVKENGGRPRRYPSSYVEPIVPWAFVIFYVLIFFFMR